MGALKQAVKLEMLARNVADAATPPRLKDDEVEILTPKQISAVRDALKGSRLEPIVKLGLALVADWENSWLCGGVTSITALSLLSGA
jgi:hypothetical protein